MAAAKLCSATGLHRFMEAVSWAAETPVRKATISPRDALLRALMFPIVYATMNFFIGEGRFGMTLKGSTPDDAYGDVVGRGLVAAGHAATQQEVAAALDDVRSAFNASLMAADDKLPLEHDPELEPGDPIDMEAYMLADGNFLNFKTSLTIARERAAVRTAALSRVSASWRSEPVIWPHGGPSSAPASRLHGAARSGPEPKPTKRHHPMRTNNPAPIHSPLIGINRVLAITSLSKASVYRLMKAGRFPASRQLTPGGRRVAWPERDVLAWAAAPFDWGDPITF